MKNKLKKLGIIVLGIVVIVSGAALFFEDQFSALASLLSQKDYVQVDESGEVLRIAYLFSPNDLDPFSSDLSTQRRLLDVYEPLVRADDSLNMRPVLAVYYGLLDEKTWELQLRKNVKFHDGTDLDASDVVYSFNEAKKRGSGVAIDLVNATESIEEVGEYSLILKTNKPDPLLLNKLSKLLIIPESYNNYKNPVGTGTYYVKESENLKDLGYALHVNYWGDPPYFSNVRVLSIPDKNMRVDDLLNGDVDFLADVPPDAVDRMKDHNINIELMPSLEVGFVMFNLRNNAFSQKEVRKAVARGINKESFLDLAFGYAKTVNQFVSNGVFGYNPQIVGYNYDKEAAIEDMNAISAGGFQKIRFKFSYPKSLKLLGQYFTEQLDLIGVELDLAPLGDLELQEKLLAQKLSFYYLGWRHESGDSLPFLKAVLHSKGENGYGIYNGMNYKNEKVDELIEKSETNFNLKERLADMQQVMQIVVEEDVVGVPIFETESIFAFAPDLSFKPRVDSLVFPCTIRKNK